MWSGRELQIFVEGKLQRKNSLNYLLSWSLYLILLKVYFTVIQSLYIGKKVLFFCIDSISFKDFTLENIQTKGQ